MKKQLPVGLIVEGNATNSAILRLPRLPEEIGPIKSTAPRVARRLSNFLRAGYAVTTYEQLFDARLILIRAPDAVLPRIIDDLRASELDFTSVCFALCESWVQSRALDPLRNKGAEIATIRPVPAGRRRWFITEGDARALRLLRGLVARSEGKTLELRNGGKELYFAAELLTTALPVPFFVAAQQALREAGLSGKHLHVLLEEMAEKMFLDFVHASRTRWGGPLSECAPEIATQQLQSLEQTDPALLRLVDGALQFALRNMPLNIRQT